MRSPFAYYGGKAGLAPKIAALLPPHRVYLEPFFGSGAVFFSKQPCMHEVINDLDAAVVTFFRVLRDRRAELVEACELTPHARAEFDCAGDLDSADVDDVERARRFWVRVNQSFAKTAGRGTGWSVTTARTQSIPGSIFTRLGRFSAIAERLAQVTIEQCDACDLVERLATPDTVVYVDPPYPFQTRTGREYGYEDYRCEMGADDEHRRLAATLHATSAAVVLSGYPCPLYDELFDGWWHVDFAQRVHSSDARTQTRGPRTERVWCNRDLQDGRLFSVHEGSNHARR